MEKGNFKVRCISNSGGNGSVYTVGKVYDVINGKLKTDNNIEVPRVSSADTFTDWQNYSSSKWELVKDNQSIIIYRKGREVIANIKDGKEVIKSAKATCNPSDEFVFETGARLAFNRLMGEEEKPEPKLFKKAKLGEKIKVIDISGDLQSPRLVLGKVYVVDYVDGVCVGSNGNYFNDGKKRYVITEENIIEDFTTEELLTEIKRRMK